MLTVNVNQSIISSFNQANKVKPALQLDDITFSVPEVWLQGECNSRVTIIAKPNNNNFEGEQTLYFIRRRLSEDLRGIKIPGKAADYTRFYEVLKVLREHLGVPLQESEFLDREISGPTLNIVTTPACMAFLPSDQITLEYSET